MELSADLSYREFTFTITIEGESYYAAISPLIDEINEEQWGLMSDDDKIVWIGNAGTSWATAAIVFSWT